MPPGPKRLEILVPPLLWMQPQNPLPLYNDLIHSMLDYGSPIYGLAPPSHLALLDPVQNAAIPISRSAPVSL